jgi:dTDP-4-dehydrorhamnose reductase
MKFLIIGATGFIGKHTLAYIKSQAYEFAGTQPPSEPPVRGLIRFDLAKNKITDCVKHDFFKKGNNKKSRNDEPIFGIILAAISKIDTCFKEKALSRAVNVENTIRLIKELDALGVIPVFPSSTSVFDGKAGNYDEESPTNPLCEYGRQKLEMENFILKNYPQAIVLRFDKVVGDTYPENSLFSEWYGLIKENKPIVCIKDNAMSPTYVRDVAKAIVLACEKRLAGLYHIANPEPFTREELARRFAKALNAKAETIVKPIQDFSFLEPRPLKTYLDSTKFIKATGMKFTPMQAVFEAFAKNVT